MSNQEAVRDFARHMLAHGMPDDDELVELVAELLADEAAASALERAARAARTDAEGEARGLPTSCGR